jgi:hypothetical protein
MSKEPLCVKSEGAGMEQEGGRTHWQGLHSYTIQRLEKNMLQGQVPQLRRGGPLGPHVSCLKEQGGNSASRRGVIGCNSAAQD